VKKGLRIADLPAVFAVRMKHVPDAAMTDARIKIGAGILYAAKRKNCAAAGSAKNFPAAVCMTKYVSGLSVSLSDSTAKKN
jgi:hypothetical protein